VAAALKTAASVALALLLAACGGVPTPSASLLNARCPDPIANPEAPMPQGRNVFVMSSSLPDCRGDILSFAKFRNHGGLPGSNGRIVNHGITTLAGPAQEPWDDQRTTFYAQDAWQEILARQVNRESNGSRLFVYIHGYNNDFEDVLEYAAVLADLDGTGAPVLAVAWPSRNRVQSYPDDEASIAWAQDYITDLLEQVAGAAGDITLVSHSMGARALIEAVKRIEDRDPVKAGHIRRAILVSPDIDRHQVLRSGGDLDQMLQSGRQVLVYTSRSDFPILASRVVHGYTRLGSSDCSFDVDYERREGGPMGNCHWTQARENFEIVETSRTTFSTGLRHSDVFDTCAGRHDLRTFLRGRLERSDYPWRIYDPENTGAGTAITADYFEGNEALCAEVDFYGDLDDPHRELTRIPAGPRQKSSSRQAVH